MKINKSVSARDKALNIYYREPNICLQCGKIIEVVEGQKVSCARRKKFCDRRCAASYNNTHSPKRKPAQTSGHCKECGQEFMFKRYPKGGYGKATYCPECRKFAHVRTLGEGKIYNERTKKELYDRAPVSLWARASITKDARKKYIDAGLPMECKVCGYDKHVQICHKRPIADFPDDALVSEINDLGNLVALCRNHHWEMDNGLFTIT